MDVKLSSMVCFSCQTTKIYRLMMGYFLSFIYFDNGAITSVVVDLPLSYEVAFKPVVGKLSPLSPNFARWSLMHVWIIFPFN